MMRTSPFFSTLPQARSVRRVLLALLPLAALAACGSDKRPGHGVGDTGGGGGSDGGDTTMDGDASATDGGPQDGSSPTADAGGLGSVPVVVAPVTPCQNHGGTTVDLVQPGMGSAIAGYTRLGKVGSRRFIGDVDDALIGFLDLPAGTITVTKPVTGNRFDFASEGATVGSAWSNATGVFYTRYAQDGTPAAPVPVSSAKADAIAIAASGTGSLVVWTVNNFQRLGASIISPAGAMSSSTGFGAGTLHTRSSVAVTPTASGYAAVWAGDANASAPKRTTLTFATISAAGVAAAPKTILTADRELTVARVVATAAGFLVLVNGAVDGTTALIPLAADGSPSGSAYEFTGSVTGLDLATSGSALGLSAVAFFNDDAGARLGTPVFHAISPAGVPTGGFICLGPANAYTTDVFDVAMDGDGNGNFSLALAKVPQHAKIVQIDATGTKPPQ